MLDDGTQFVHNGSLALVDDAQASFGDVRGGSKNRIKDQGIYGTFGKITGLLYEGKTAEGGGRNSGSKKGSGCARCARSSARSRSSCDTRCCTIPTTRTTIKSLF